MFIIIVDFSLKGTTAVINQFGFHSNLEPSWIYATNSNECDYRVSLKKKNDLFYLMSFYSRMYLHFDCANWEKKNTTTKKYAIGVRIVMKKTMSSFYNRWLDNVVFKKNKIKKRIWQIVHVFNLLFMSKIKMVNSSIWMSLMPCLFRFHAYM